MVDNASAEQAKQPVRLFDGELSKSKSGILVSLTYDALDSQAQINRVKCPQAGAVVLFAGMSSQCGLY